MLSLPAVLRMAGFRSELHGPALDESHDTASDDL